MKYQFRLQKILDIKEKQEDSKKNEVFNINRELIKANEELKEIEEEISFQNKKRDEKNAQGASIQEIVELNKYLQYLDATLQEKINQINDIRQKLEEKKQEYIESRKERKSYENLKEKDYQKYMEKEAKEEEQIIDQIVSFANRKI